MNVPQRVALGVFYFFLLVVTVSGCRPTAEEAREPAASDLEMPESEVAEAPEPAPTTPPEPVVLNMWEYEDILTLDPQLAEDFVSITEIENLFVHLTNYYKDTADVVPETAIRWEISEDGLVYTFQLRTDIPWVKHDPATGLTTQEVDEAGKLRFVTADDFVYGIKRACNPHLGSYYSSVVGPLIKGCEALLYMDDPADQTLFDKLNEAIGVSAPAADRLVIELAYPASYFLQMTPIWTLAAAPSWAIEAHGVDWIEPGNIVTNGRYVLHRWQHGVTWELWRNPLLPADLYGDGNIDRVETKTVPDISTGYALWLTNEVDFSGIPTAELETHQTRYPDETFTRAGMDVYWVSFRMTKPPFDDVRVRRAFSAAIDRQSYVDDVRMGMGQPMKHFAPPGIFGAPPIDEVGVGFNPEYARAQLAAAGYPNCDGLPQVTILGFEGPESLNQLEFLQAQWQEHLGCDLGQIVIQQSGFGELLAATAPEVPDEEVPHMWTLGWAADYPDENNWVGELWCQSVRREKRNCNELDDLIVAAREEPDPERRVALYRQIEEGFFGPDGEMPFAPIYVSVGRAAVHSWFTFIPSYFSGLAYFDWTIDWPAKQAALASG